MTRTVPPSSGPSRPAAVETSKRAVAERARARRRRIVIAAAAAVVLVAVAALAVQRSTPGADSLGAAPPRTQGAADGPASVGQPITDFRLVTADGAQVTPSRLAGNDAILWFTTTYCVPCQVGAVKYQALARELGDKAPTMLFVFLDPQEPVTALKQFRDKYGLPEWAMALDTDQLGQRAGVQVLDTKIFVDEIGIVRDIDTAPVDDAYLADVRRLATGA
jgi:cytochrome oxidase Cu insertion factor (SCO1/SenC/PrrC family)